MNRAEKRERREQLLARVERANAYIRGVRKGRAVKQPEPVNPEPESYVIEDIDGPKDPTPASPENESNDER